MITSEFESSSRAAEGRHAASESPPSPLFTNHRVDIQALRGVAVLFVLLHHAGIRTVRAGYLGVDVFFVISGFLITGLIARGVGAGTFSLRDFYFRRAKRLLPAAYATFALTTVAVLLLGTPSNLHDYSRQLFGAVTFTSNLALRDQTGYFAESATVKPLLHTWSLSIEEQFYLVLPATLLLLRRRWWTAGVGVMLVASLGYCLAIRNTNPDDAFYLLPSRMWELLVGAAGALFVFGRRDAATVVPVHGVTRQLLWGLAAAVVVVLPFRPMREQHPGFNAILICLATLTLLLLRRESLPGWPGRAALTTLTRVGDMSYSLYLVHWPMFAIVTDTFIAREMPRPLRWALIVVSLIAGWLLHRLVERPIHRGSWRRSWRPVAAAAVATVALLVTAKFLALRGLSGPYESLRQATGLPDCYFEDRPFTAEDARCRTGPNPRMVVWGDSFADHLVAGIVASARFDVQQATKSVCGPFLGVSPITRGSKYDHPWPASCVRFNDDVVHWLAGARGIEVVVMSSPLGLHFEREPDALFAREADGTFRERAGGLEYAVSRMLATIDTVRATGKRVVLVSPPPSGEYHSRRCNERRHAGMLSLPRSAYGCDVPVAWHRHAHRTELQFLRTVSARSRVPVFYLDSLLCAGDRCVTELAGTIIYRDFAHLSRPGSEMIGRRFRLADTLMTMAR